MVARWTALQLELMNDPLNLGYANDLVVYSEGSLLNKLNNPSILAPNGSVMRSERGVIDKYPDGPIAADKVLAKLEAFSETEHPMASLVARALKFLGQPEGIDFGAVTTQGLIMQLAQGGVIEMHEAQKLCSLGQVLVSRAQQLGLRVVTSEQLVAAIFDENGDRLIG